jgi:hypothetical protein
LADLFGAQFDGQHSDPRPIVPLIAGAALGMGRTRRGRDTEQAPLRE